MNHYEIQKRLYQMAVKGLDLACRNDEDHELAIGAAQCAHTLLAESEGMYFHPSQPFSVVRFKQVADEQAWALLQKQAI